LANIVEIVTFQNIIFYCSTDNNFVSYLYFQTLFRRLHICTMTGKNWH